MDSPLPQLKRKREDDNINGNTSTAPGNGSGGNGGSTSAVGTPTTLAPASAPFAVANGAVSANINGMAPTSTTSALPPSLSPTVTVDLIPPSWALIEGFATRVNRRTALATILCAAMIVYNKSQTEQSQRISISRLGVCATILSASVAKVEGRDVAVARACAASLCQRAARAEGIHVPFRLSVADMRFGKHWADHTDSFHLFPPVSLHLLFLLVCGHNLALL